MTRRFRIAAGAIAAALGILAAASCGGDNGPSLEEYFEELEAIAEEGDEIGDEREEQLDEDLEAIDDPASDETKEAMISFIEAALERGEESTEELGVLSTEVGDSPGE
ncbi:MAG: hypothetical protein GEU28_05835 [Dehalococcoidia bacterium]|nr:hypothetical protein [Dehalococcoidia bacterium]